MKRLFVLSIIFLLILTACSAGQVGIDETNQPVRIQQNSNPILGLNEGVIEGTTDVAADLIEVLSVMDEVTIVDVIVLPVPVSNNASPKYGLAVKLLTDNPEMNSMDTVRDVLRITRETAVIEPLSYSVLIEYDGTFTNYVWRPASNLWESVDITPFASETLVVDPAEQRAVYVTFTADWQACPRMTNSDCPVFVQMPKGAYAVVSGRTDGQRVEGSDIWYISSYFGIPAYVPFARISGT